MTDLAVTDRLPSWPLRATSPRHTAKHHSRRFRLAAETIRKWLVDGVPVERRRAYAAVLYAELARIERDIAQVRAFADWCQQGESGDAVACAQNRGLARTPGATPHGFRDRRQEG